MTDRRRGVLLAAMLVADTAWLFVAIGIAGFFAGQGGSPLPWSGVLALLVAAILASRLRVGLPFGGESAELVQGGLGAVAAYAVIAAGGLGSAPGPAWGARLVAGDYPPAWGARLVAGDYPAIDVLGLVVAVLASAMVWRHGFAIVAERSALRRVMLDFRVGIVVIAMGLLVEQAASVDLGTAHMLAPFFAASLAGLALARLPDSAGSHGSWVRVVATTVVAVVALGVVLGLTAGIFGRDGIAWGIAGLGYLADGVLWGVRTLLTAVLEAVMSLVLWLQEGDAATDAGAAGAGGDLSLWERAGLEQGSGLVSTLTELAQIAFFGALLFVFWRLLVFAYREPGVVHREMAGEDHEPLEGRPDRSADLLRLFRTLLPAWAQGEDSPFDGRRFSSLAPGIADVFSLYFELLSAAVRRGHEFDPTKTPLERVPELLAIVPDAPVERITSRFNAACYGREETRAELVARLRRELECAIDDRS